MSRIATFSALLFSSLVLCLLAGSVAIPAALASGQLATGGQMALLVLSCIALGAVTIPGGVYRDSDRWVNANGKEVAGPDYATYEKLVSQGMAPAEAFVRAQGPENDEGKKKSSKSRSGATKPGEEVSTPPEGGSQASGKNSGQSGPDDATPAPETAEDGENQ